MERHRRALQRLGPERAPFGHLVDQHHLRVADLHRRVHQPAVRARQARALLRAERLLVELDRLRRAGADEMRGDGMHALRNLHVSTSLSLRGTDFGRTGGKASAMATAPRPIAAEPTYIHV